MAACLWLLACVPAMAQRTEGDRAAASGAYDAEVAVRNQTDGERNSAFGRALAQVLANATGDRGAAQQPGVRDELSKAKGYVASYDYRQDEGFSSNGSPSFQTTLVVRFKRDDVDGLIQMLGLPSWPMPRPKPVLWLGIDDGSGPRLVALAQVNAARAVLDQAKQRGYALGLPSGSAAEQAAVGAIWRGDTAAIASLSKRYSPPMQLVGKLQRGAGGWVADWIFVDKGKVLSKWQTKHPDARRAMAGGADGAADALFKRYAKAGSGGPPGRYRVRILGIDSADDYLRLSGYLEGISIVKRVTPVSAMPDVLELDLELATGIANFAKYADRGEVLSTVVTDIRDQDDDGEPAAPQVATFRLDG
ncbi:hypothetical protein GCM10010080_10010 [Thermomonas carbonis]|uniref:DUF2066 domain-containing protein n=2 Tax=Thermomonas carbonis TaxID=1463158 RepID=A0A7G9SUF3_9GAMM|nr:DUF2066 domain-containing protein [Thermomonas carbonis]QNN71478.1 DUF2066 domain-containing protein [Thermomonas carbonis]GHB99240.1 hypothetical protein GCM10010080_10010 [Thermomonas carbonis]